MYMYRYVNVKFSSVVVQFLKPQIRAKTTAANSLSDLFFFAPGKRKGVVVRREGGRGILLRLKRGGRALYPKIFWGNQGCN